MPRRTEVGQTITSIDYNNSNNNNNKWIPKQTSEEKCQIRLLQKLLELKKQNILRRCFLLESNEFEVLEFYGDAYLYERVSYFIMTTRRFMDPNLMTKLRSSCIKNANLATVFEQLKLSELFETIPANLPLKSKADILEAIIGELAEDSSSISEDLLTELIAYIAYMGDKEYFHEANANSNSSSIGEGTNGTPKKNKPRRRHRSRKGSVNSISNNRSIPDIKSPPVASSNISTTTSDKPLFILLRPSTNPNLPLSPKQPTSPATSSLPQTTGRIIRLEPNNNENRLPLNNALSPLPPAPVMNKINLIPPSPLVGKEPPPSTTAVTRNIFFHKLSELSSSSDSSSGSASLSSSPRNLFLIPTLGNGYMKNFKISDDPILRLNEMKRL